MSIDVELILFLIINAVGWAFWGGVLWTKVRNMERMLTNGISEQIRNTSKDIAEINMKCATRGLIIEDFQKHLHSHVH